VTRLTIILLTTYAGIALASCGSSSTSTTSSNGQTQHQSSAATGSSPTTPASTGSGVESHAQLIAALNAACVTTNAKYSALTAGAATSGTRAQVLTDAAAIYQSEVAQLATLRPGPADRAALDRYSRAVTGQSSTYKRLAEATRPEAEVPLAALEATYRRQRISAATRIGAHQCTKQ
jgi:hypothetical protein